MERQRRQQNQTQDWQRDQQYERGRGRRLHEYEESKHHTSFNGQEEQNNLSNNSSENNRHYQLPIPNDIDQKQLCLNDLMMLAMKTSEQEQQNINQRSGSTNDTFSINNNNNNNSASRSRQILSQSYDLSMSMSSNANSNSNGQAPGGEQGSNSVNSGYLSFVNTTQSTAPRVCVVEMDRVVNKEMVQSEVECQICHGVLMSPMECNTCENCFCMNCLQKWLQESGKCPFKCEGTPDFKMKPHKIIRNMLSKLKLRCRNESSGCLDVIDYSKLETHEEVECKFQLCDCPAKEFGCQEQIQREHVDKHLREECEFVQKECKHCGLLVSKNQLRDHLENCESALMTCSYCKYQVRKKNFEIHLEAECIEMEISCRRCQGSFKRKHKDNHDCVRHLQDQQQSMVEQIKGMRQDIQSQDQKFDRMENLFKSEISKLTSLLSNAIVSDHDEQQIENDEPPEEAIGQPHNNNRIHNEYK